MEHQSSQYSCTMVTMTMMTTTTFLQYVPWKEFPSVIPSVSEESDEVAAASAITAFAPVPFVADNSVADFAGVDVDGTNYDCS